MDTQLLSEQAIKDLEYRVIQEEFSSRLYEDMSLWFEDNGYSNLAKLYNKYSKEESLHASWAKDFLLSFNLKPILRGIPSPEQEYTDCEDILNKTLEHEIDITKQCQKLAVDSFNRGEVVLQNLALKYCNEQEEEMRKSYDLLSIYKLTSDMLIFDSYIGENYLD